MIHLKIHHGRRKLEKLLILTEQASFFGMPTGVSWSREILEVAVTYLETFEHVSSASPLVKASQARGRALVRNSLSQSLVAVKETVSEKSQADIHGVRNKISSNQDRSLANLVFSVHSRFYFPLDEVRRNDRDLLHAVPYAPLRASPRTIQLETRRSRK